MSGLAWCLIWGTAVGLAAYWLRRRFEPAGFDADLEAEICLRRCLKLSAEMSEFYSPERVVEWFFERDAIFGNRRPVDMIRDDFAWAELNARVAPLVKCGRESA